MNDATPWMLPVLDLGEGVTVRVSVRQHVRWRFDRYRELLDALGRQGRSLAAFSSLPHLPPDLRTAEDAIRIHLSDRLRRDLHRGVELPDDRAPPREGPDMVALRIAQNDPELDLVRLHPWRAFHQDRLVRAIRGSLEEGLREIGEGPGGEDVAFAAALGLVASLRSHCASRAQAMLVASWLQAEVDRLADSPWAEQISPQFGLRWMTLIQPLALGVDAYELARCPLGFYGTEPLAMQWARKILTEPLEDIPLHRAEEALSLRLVSTPDAALRVTRAAFLERLRDGLLAALDHVSRSGALPQAAEPLRAAAGSLLQLTRDTFNSRRRKVLTDTLRELELPASLREKLDALLEQAKALAAGRPESVAPEADLFVWGRRMAQAALTLRLDEVVTEKLGLERIVVEPSESGRVAHAEGRALGLGLNEGVPAYHFRRRERQTTAHVDLRVEPWAEARAERSLRSVLTPVASRFRGREGLSFDESGPDRWRVRGPVWAVVRWAVQIRRAVDRCIDDLTDDSPEISARRLRLEARLERLQRRAARDPSRSLDDEIALLRQERQDLRDRAPLAAGIAVARAGVREGPWVPRTRARQAAEGVRWARDLPQGPDRLRAEPVRLQVHGRDGQAPVEEDGVANRGLLFDDATVQGLEDEARLEGVRFEPPLPMALRALGTAGTIPLWVEPRAPLVLRRVGPGWWEWVAPECRLHAWAQQRVETADSRSAR